MNKLSRDTRIIVDNMGTAHLLKLLLKLEVFDVSYGARVAHHYLDQFIHYGVVKVYL